MLTSILKLYERIPFLLIEELIALSVVVSLRLVDPILSIITITWISITGIFTDTRKFASPNLTFWQLASCRVKSKACWDTILNKLLRSTFEQAVSICTHYRAQIGSQWPFSMEVGNTSRQRKLHACTESDRLSTYRQARKRKQIEIASIRFELLARITTNERHDTSQ